MKKFLIVLAYEVSCSVGIYFSILFLCYAIWGYEAITPALVYVTILFALVSSYILQKGFMEVNKK